MLSFGWSEIALVLVVVVIIIGPKEIPNLLRQLGSFSKSLKKISRQFKSSLNDLAEETDLKEIKDSINTIADVKKTLDPTKELKKEFKESINTITDIKKTLDPSNELKEEINTIKETATFTDKEIKNINSKIIKDNK